jgi:hypothetical protein
MSTIQSEQYQLKGTIGDVVAAHRVRSEAVESIVKVLADANAINRAVVNDWQLANSTAANMKEQVLSDQGNTLVRGLDGALRTVDRLGGEIVAEAKITLTNSAVVLSPNERKQILSAIAASESAVGPISTAREKYTIEVQTYNQIISVFPISWTAKMLGEESRVGLDNSSSTSKAKDAGKLIEVATGSR